MIANLMMYARTELAAETNRLWKAIRAALGDNGIRAPDTLSQDTLEFAVWTDPTLVLSQTCGMPYRLWLHDRVSLIGTPDYGVEDAPAGYYKSAFVVRTDDPREALPEFETATFAYNQKFSQSGYAAAYAACKPFGFWFKDSLQTGQHRGSAQAVAEGRADIAALDAVSWSLMRRYDRFADHLRVLTWTTPTPGLPLITAQHDLSERMFDAVQEAICTLSVTDRETLLLKGLVHIPIAHYLAVPNPPDTPQRMPKATI